MIYEQNTYTWYQEGQRSGPVDNSLCFVQKNRLTSLSITKNSYEFQVVKHVTFASF